MSIAPAVYPQIFLAREHARGELYARSQPQHFLIPLIIRAGAIDRNVPRMVGCPQTLAPVQKNRARKRPIKSCWVFLFLLQKEIVMKKLMLVGVMFTALTLLSLGSSVAAQEKYSELIGTWQVNIETCRPCIMTITAIDGAGNVSGTHTSLYGETTPLVGKIVVRKGGLWLVAKADYGKAIIETAFCENESDGHYTVIARVPTHHRANYKKVAALLP